MTAIFTVILALAATIAAFILLLPEKKQATLPKWAAILADILNFKYLLLESILRFLYIFMTAFCLIGGFFGMFRTVTNPWTGETTWIGAAGLALMLLGPIVVRLSFEGLMMMILLVKNVIQINQKLKGSVEDQNSSLREVLEKAKADREAAKVAAAQKLLAEQEAKKAADEGDKQ